MHFHAHGLTVQQKAADHILPAPGSRLPAPDDKVDDPSSRRFRLTQEGELSSLKCVWRSLILADHVWFSPILSREMSRNGFDTHTHYTVRRSLTLCPLCGVLSNAAATPRAASRELRAGTFLYPRFELVWSHVGPLGSPQGNMWSAQQSPSSLIDGIASGASAFVRVCVGLCVCG
jgi:hypothetical protein